MENRDVKSGAVRHGSTQRFRPVLGGIQIVVPARRNVEAGTIGVTVKHIGSGKLGYVASGHVVEAVDNKVFQPSSGVSNEAGIVTRISNFHAGTADAAFVEFEGDRRARTVPGRIYSSGNDINPVTFTVDGVKAVAVGNQVLMQGINNKAPVGGGVVAVQATVKFEDGGVLTDQIICTYTTKSGDSGAPVFVETPNPGVVQMVGINVGAATEKDITSPQLPPGTYAVCSPWGEVLKALGPMSFNA